MDNPVLQFMQRNESLSSGPHMKYIGQNLKQLGEKNVSKIALHHIVKIFK